MRLIAFALACFAFAGHCRRLEIQSNQIRSNFHEQQLNSQKMARATSSSGSAADLKQLQFHGHAELKHLQSNLQAGVPSPQNAFVLFLEALNPEVGWQATGAMHGVSSPRRPLVQVRPRDAHRIPSSSPSRGLKNIVAGILDRDWMYDDYGERRFKFRNLKVWQALMGVNLAAFAAQSCAPRTAIIAGARMNLQIMRTGEFYRLITPVFLHHGWIHLLMNTYSMWRVGPLVEEKFGKTRALLLYMISGFCGNLLGFFFGPMRSISVGASGAVFGMMGAVAGYVLRNKKHLGQYGNVLLQSVGMTLLLNLLLGMRPGIDNMAHIGGFASGLAFGAALAPMDDADSRTIYSGYPGPWRDRDDPHRAILVFLGVACVGYAASLFQMFQSVGAIMHRFGRL